MGFVSFCAVIKTQWVMTDYEFVLPSLLSSRNGPYSELPYLKSIKFHRYLIIFTGTYFFLQ